MATVSVLMLPPFSLQWDLSLHRATHLWILTHMECRDWGFYHDKQFQTHSYCMQGFSLQDSLSCHFTLKTFS